MFLLEWSTSDLLMMALAALVTSGLVVWLVPSAQAPAKRRYTTAEITVYDRRIPRYFLFAALALVIGGAHIVIKNVPGFWHWLWAAGYGGHLFRDLANSHIIIVGGGTVLLTGLTWYVLPRCVNRPLYSNALAGASLWFTVIGVFGFYLAWLVLGLVEGGMVHSGWEYMAAKEAVGAWHRVPTRMTSSIMGVGYWTYVLNVMLTVGAARNVAVKPRNYLTKFSVVAAGALLVGTVQGVLQVLPANADWIHYAGKFGQYVDPISHAHINLVTGMMVALAGLLAFFAERMGGHPVSRRRADMLLWVLTGGSLLFYLTFLLLGLILGNAVTGYGGIHAPGLVPFLGLQRARLLAVAGSAMLAGFWLYFVTVWCTFGLRRFASEIRAATPAGFWLVSSIALVIGTLQGLLQVLPATAHVLTVPEEVPNIHAQLNMIGGVLPALMGTVYLLLPELVGATVPLRTRRLTLAGIGVGIGGYYAVTLVTGLVRWSYMAQGADVIASAARLGWIAPALLLVTALPLFVGFAAFGAGIYGTTRAYRADLIVDAKGAPARYTGPLPAVIRAMPRRRVIGMELAGGLLGWPGLGWLYAGQAMPGVALLLAGSSITWALLPSLFSPYAQSALSPYGWSILLLWLPTSALTSAGALARYLHHRRPAPAESAASRPRPWWRTLPRAPMVGVALVLLALFSVPIIPLLMGIPTAVAEQPLMSELAARANGAYLDLGDGSRSGMLKLFPWSFPLDEFPTTAPAVNPAHVRGIFVTQKGLDDAAQYQLYHVEDEDHAEPVALRAEVLAFQKELQLTPNAPLAPGNYMLSMPTGGMFAGREFYFFRIDPAVASLPPVVTPAQTERTESAPTGPDDAETGALVILPLISALLSAALAGVMGRRLLARTRPHEAAWTVAFLLFAVAAGAQVAGDLTGWTPWLARIYYVAGASLVVGWLGLGTWLLLVSKPGLRRSGVWTMLLLSGYAVGLVSMAQVEPALLDHTGWHALDKPLPLTVLTIALNAAGTLLLVGGALYSAWIFWRKGIMRQRMIGCLLLAGGAITVAAGGSLTRFGHQEYLYIAMSSGITVMFWGYLKTIQREPSPMPSRRRFRPPQVPVSAEPSI